MIKNTIASEPMHGWRRKVNQSKSALEWLHWLERDGQERCIQHAGNSGEYRIPGTRYSVDGYDQESNIVYEFQGCFWHGCPDCYKNRKEKHRRLEDRTMEAVYECCSVPDKRRVSGQKPDRGSYLTRQMKWKIYLDITTIADKKKED